MVLVWQIIDVTIRQIRQTFPLYGILYNDSLQMAINICHLLSPRLTFIVSLLLETINVTSNLNEYT